MKLNDITLYDDNTMRITFWYSGLSFFIQKHYYFSNQTDTIELPKEAVNMLIDVITEAQKK